MVQAFEGQQGRCKDDAAGARGVHGRNPAHRRHCGRRCGDALRGQRATPWRRRGCRSSSVPGSPTFHTRWPKWHRAAPGRADPGRAHLHPAAAGRAEGQARADATGSSTTSPSTTGPDAPCATSTSRSPRPKAPRPGTPRPSVTGSSSWWRATQRQPGAGGQGAWDRRVEALPDQPARPDSGACAWRVRAALADREAVSGKS